MHFFKWLIGGIIGGAIGAAAWVGIENFTQAEHGWIAWPVGLLVGWGVHKAASKDTRGGFLRGAVAAVLALGVIMGAMRAKTEILQAQAKKNSQGIAVKEAVKPVEQGEAAPTGGAVEVEPEVFVPPALAQGGGVGRPVNAFKEMDMVWICLAAVTAYIFGKGPGPSALPQGSDSSADARKEDEGSETDETDDQ